MLDRTDQPMLSVDHLNKYFGAFQALHDINLKVATGEKVVICGPSGSGKSTLIRCMNALEPFQAGTMQVGGIDLSGTRKSVDAVRRITGMVFQGFNLFPHLTAVQNCMIALRKVKGQSAAEAREIALHYLQRVRIPEQADKYPGQLSGGQQQRVAIARALCMEPQVMLYDEPTSALDPEMVKEVLDTILELSDGGTTMLCVTHEMNFARRVADRIVFMDRGAIVEIAEAEAFFSQPRSSRATEFLSQILH